MARLFEDTDTVRMALGKIIPVVLLALFLSAVLLSVVNDMYAFFKPQGEIRLSIDEPCTLRDFSNLLEENWILGNPYCFSLYVRAKDRSDAIQAVTGELMLDRARSYREMLNAISSQ